MLRRPGNTLNFPFLKVKEKGLNNIKFEECNIKDAELCVDAADLIVGLHCCGGLAEAAVAFSIAMGASFAVCCCCFCSNHDLAYLTKTAVKDLRASGYLTISQDIKYAQQLAQRENCDEQFRAQRVLCKLRLHYSAELLNIKHPGRELVTSLQQLPEGCSSQVCIMVGRCVEKKTTK